MRTVLLRHFPQLAPALAGRQNPFAPWQRVAGARRWIGGPRRSPRRRPDEGARPGVHSLGHGKGGHVHAFLLDDGGELTLVDTLFEGDGRLVLDEIRRLGRKPARPEADRDHARPPLASRRLAALKRATGATVYAHPWEADIVSGDRRRRRYRCCRSSR